MGLSGCQNVVIGLVLLKHAPHTLDVIAGVAPITLSINVSEVQALVDSLVDAGDRGRNLTGDEGAATAGTLMVEENTVGKVHAVGLTVIDKNPEGILLGNGVGRTGVEGSGLGLRDLLHLAVELGGGGLVELHLLFHTTSADGIEHTKNANTIGIGGILGHIERNLDVRHGAEVVDLGGTDLGNDGDQVGGIAEIAIVQEELHAGRMTVLVEMVDAASVEGRRTTDDAVDLNVCLLKENDELEVSNCKLQMN